MTEYPEWLRKRIATALAEQPLIDDENLEEWYMREWFSDGALDIFAVAVLNVLGFKSEDNMPNIWWSGYQIPAKGEMDV